MTKEIEVLGEVEKDPREKHKENQRNNQKQTLLNSKRFLSTVHWKYIQGGDG